jgi:type I site-specific restriction endonuclease
VGGGPPKDDDEDAKRFDMLVPRRQLAQLEGDAEAERLREQIQNIASGLLIQTAIPSVAAQQVLLDEVASDDWWVDVMLPMLELGRRKLRSLRRVLEKAKKASCRPTSPTSSAKPLGSTCPARFTRRRDRLGLQADRRRVAVASSHLATLSALYSTVYRRRF